MRHWAFDLLQRALWLTRVAHIQEKGAVGSSALVPQRPPPPIAIMRELVAASIFYMLCSAGMSVFNKLAVRAFPLPITLVVVQMMFTLVTLLLKRKSIHIGSMRDAMRWGLTVPVLFAGMLVSSMIAMEHNTLGTIVVFRNVAPLFTLFIERMFRIPMQVNVETIASLLSIVLGVVLYHFQAIGLTRMGLLAICLNMAFAVLERLMQRHLMAQAPVDISKPGMMLLNNACGLLPCGLLMLVYGETARWSEVAEQITPGAVMLILISCVNGLAISYAVRYRRSLSRHPHLFPPLLTALHDSCHRRAYVCSSSSQRRASWC